ncbi:MAG: thioredoxin family protein [Planctomycetota bacterium]
MKHLVPFGIAFAACILIFVLATNRSVDEVSTSVEPPAVATARSASLEGKGIVLLKFGATWCPPCRMIDKELEILDEAGLPIEIRKIDVDEQPQMANDYGVSSIPRLILVQDGREIGDKLGFMPASKIQKWILDSADTDSADLSVQADPPPVQSNPFMEGE